MIKWFREQYITREEAKVAGFTHEGKLYGLPAWFINDGQDEEEYFFATPKFMALEFWCQFGDWVYNMASYLVPSHMVLATPIRVTNPI